MPNDEVAPEEEVERKKNAWLDIYEKCIEEGHNSIERQFELFDQNKESAEKLLAANTGILGLVLTILSLANLTGEGSPLFDISLLSNQYTMAGLGFVLLSIGTTVLAYSPIRQVIGINGEALKFIAKENVNEIEERGNTQEQFSSDDQLVFYNWLTNEYGERIINNKDTNIKKAMITATALLFFIYELTFLTLGVIDAFLGDVGSVIIIVTVLFLVLVTIISNVPSLLLQLFNR